MTRPGPISFSNFQGLRTQNMAHRDARADPVSTITAVQVPAPVINTQTLQWVFHPSLETALKVPGDGFAYIFADAEHPVHVRHLHVLARSPPAPR